MHGERERENERDFFTSGQHTECTCWMSSGPHCACAYLLPPSTLRLSLLTDQLARGRAREREAALQPGAQPGTLRSRTERERHAGWRRQREEKEGAGRGTDRQREADGERTNREEGWAEGRPDGRDGGTEEEDTHTQPESQRARGRRGRRLERRRYATAPIATIDRNILSRSFSVSVSPPV